MKIEQHKHGAVSVVKPVGPLAGEDGGAVRDLLLELRGRSLGRMLLDLSAVPLVDSQGLESLLDVTEELAMSGHALKVCGVREIVREVLELTELAPSFELFDDVSSAVRSFL